MRHRKWTKRDTTRSYSQGWGVFDYDGTGLLEICKLDEADDFGDDDGALRHVIERASLGQVTARKALALHVRDAAKLADARGFHG